MERSKEKAALKCWRCSRAEAEAVLADGKDEDQSVLLKIECMHSPRFLKWLGEIARIPCTDG